MYRRKARGGHQTVVYRRLTSITGHLELEVAHLKTSEQSCRTKKGRERAQAPTTLIRKLACLQVRTFFEKKR